MLWGSIAAEATAALGHTLKGNSGGVNGRGCPSLAFLRHHRRTRRERLLQHHSEAKRRLGHPNSSAHDKQSVSLARLRLRRLSTYQDLPHAATDRCGDASGCLHLGAGDFPTRIFHLKRVGLKIPVRYPPGESPPPRRGAHCPRRSPDTGSSTLAPPLGDPWPTALSAHPARSPFRPQDGLGERYPQCGPAGVEGPDPSPRLER